MKTLGLFASILLVSSQQVSAQCEHRFRAHDGTTMDLFGQRTGLSGEFVAVSAFLADGVSNPFTGAVYVFRRKASGSWLEVAKLTALDEQSGDRFGEFLALDGDVLLASAVEDDDGGVNAGAVYAFERDSGHWLQTQKLVPSDAEEWQSFGSALSLDGDRVLIGADGRNAGSAYVYQRGGSGWEEEVRLIPSGSRPDDRVGNAVALAGDLLVIGDEGYDHASVSNAGAAFVFERVSEQWIETATLISSEPAEGDRFGISVAIHEERIVVGSPGDDDAGTSSGSAHVFEKTDSGEWVLRSRLTANDGARFDFFGYSVDVGERWIAVGAINADAPGVDTAGAVYVFERTEGGWSQAFKLVPEFTANLHQVGSAVSIDGDRVGVGLDNCCLSPGIDDAYVFDLPFSTYGQRLGGGPRLEGCGCVAPGSSFTLRASQGTPGSPGVLVIGKSRRFPMSPGDGLLVSPDILTSPHTLDDEGAADLPFLSLPPALIGRTFYAQTVYPSFPVTTAWSNGLELRMNPGEISARAFEH